MKTTTNAVIAYLNAARAAADAPIAFADCFTFTLATGVVLAYTNIDQPVVYNGAAFSATGPLVQGLKYKCAFDGATVQRDRVFLTALGGAVIGGVTLFHGRVSTIDNVGRTSAQITVASDLIVLDYDMPRNLYSPTCLHTLYDSGCGVIRGTYAANGAAGTGSTSSRIAFAGALALHAQGSIVFTSGVNANVRATIKGVAVGASLSLVYPLPSTPATGDGFTVYAGCDHTSATCASRFNNIGNFRGFPYVPPPQIAF